MELPDAIKEKMKLSLIMMRKDLEHWVKEPNDFIHFLALRDQRTFLIGLIVGVVIGLLISFIL